MFFIYHFITLDEKKVEVVSEPSGKVITQAIDEGITNPQLLSTMITTAIGKWGQIKIAGESIQRRLGGENIIDLMKNYDYPNETDYVILGEINTLSKNYEIDLKIMDVSTQDIILSHAFQIPKDAIEELRNEIDKEVSGFMYNLLKPFCGLVSIKVDDSSRDFLRWDYISIRPLKTQVGGKIINTEEKDLKIVEISRGSGINGLLKTYYLKSTKNEYQDYGIVWDETFKTIPLGFLFGDYELVAFLNGNKDKYQTFFKVIPGQMTQIDITIDYQPPPPPTKITIPTGNLAISNLFEGVNINLSKIENDDEIISKVKASVLDGELRFNYKDKSIEYSRNKSELLLTNLQLGTYLLGAYTISNETFPGKYYTLLYAFEDTIWINKRGGQNNISLPDKKNKSGREIIIYLSPFPESKDEEYKLFLDKSTTPFSVVSNVGEIHIEGVAYDFSGNMIVKRDGYEPSSLSIEPGEEKLYLHADLSQKSKKSSDRESFNPFNPNPNTSHPPITPKTGKPLPPEKSKTSFKAKAEKSKTSFKAKAQSNKIEKQFGAGIFSGFPGGTLNGIADFSKNKYNLSLTYGTDFSDMSGFEIGIGIRLKTFNNYFRPDNEQLIKLVMGSRWWGEFGDYSYKGIMINKKIKNIFGEVGIVSFSNDLYDGPQLVMKLGLMK